MKPYETGRKRKIQKHLFLSEAEMQMIEERMKRCHYQDFSAYARRMMIDGGILVIDDLTEIRQFTLELVT